MYWFDCEADSNPSLASITLRALHLGVNERRELSTLGARRQGTSELISVRPVRIMDKWLPSKRT